MVLLTKLEPRFEPTPRRVCDMTHKKSVPFTLGQRPRTNTRTKQQQQYTAKVVAVKGQTAPRINSQRAGATYLGGHLGRLQLVAEHAVAPAVGKASQVLVTGALHA